MKTLNEFYERTINFGGASHSLSTTSVPQTGFAVSIAGTEKVISINEFTKESIKEFISKNYNHLAKEENFLGSWVNGTNVYLDVSKAIQSKEVAIYEGIKGDQKAIFDLENLEVINLPSPQRSGTGSQRDSYARLTAQKLAS